MKYYKEAMFAVTAVIAVLCSQAYACTVSANGIAFGQFNPLDGMPTDGEATITVNCTTETAFDVFLSPGTGTLNRGS